MLLGLDEFSVVRGSVFSGTWVWTDSVTGDPEDFAGRTAIVKIKNIHEDFEDEVNTFTVGTAIVEPLDADSNTYKGRIEVTLSKEDTLKFAIPESELDPYGDSDFYAILSIILDTDEVVLQAKVRVLEGLV